MNHDETPVGEWDVAVAAVLEDHRKQRRMNQEELGDATGVSSKTVRRYLAAERSLSIEWVSKAATALGVSMEELLHSAGLLSNPVSVERAISADDSLGPYKEAALAMIEGLRMKAQE